MSVTYLSFILFSLFNYITRILILKETYMRAKPFYERVFPSYTQLLTQDTCIHFIFILAYYLAFL